MCYFVQRMHCKNTIFFIRYNFSSFFIVIQKELSVCVGESFGLVGSGFVDVAFPWLESFQGALPAGAVEGGETVLRLDHVAIFGSGLDAL